MAVGLKCLTCNTWMERQGDAAIYICTAGCYTVIKSHVVTRNMAKTKRVFIRPNRNSKWRMIYGMTK